jgi:hypothetical protein
MTLKYQKLVTLNFEEKRGLENVLREIKGKGGNISMMKLIRDSINIFLEFYTTEAVKKYSPSNYRKKEVDLDEIL